MLTFAITRSWPVRFPLWARLAVGALLALGFVQGAQAAGTAFRLGPEDRVRLKVFEWRASQDLVFEWKALNDEFMVGAGGALAVPLAGAVPAAGHTPDEVAKTIAERLQQRMHLAEPPDVSINMVQYRPFFVAGDVAHPGPYPYHPGLTVLEAVATAGGASRLGDLGMMRLGREVIDAEGDLAQLGLQADAMLVRRARLQAELDGRNVFDLPAALARRSDDPQVLQVVRNETQILGARRQAFLTQSEALNTLKAFLAKETDSLTQQLGTLDTQMTLINKELASVSSLVEKGMAVAPRQLALERSVAQIQGDRLSMQTSMLRVQEEISRADMALIELRNGRQTEDSIELRDIQEKLDDTMSRTETRKRLLYESQVVAPGLISGRLNRAKLQPSYTVLHQDPAAPAETAVTEATELSPGDTVKVTMPLPEGPETSEDAAATAQAATPAIQ